MKLNLYSLAYPVTALGPGRRVALWVAGCPLHCEACITPGLLSADAGKPIDIERVAQRLFALPVVVDGITLTGGEPFAQAQALSALLDAIKGRCPHWNVLTFSGFPIESLRHGTLWQRRLLARIDVLVDGPYAARQPGHHPLLASANQRMHLLTRRARELEEDFVASPRNAANLGLNPDTDGWLIGILDSASRRRLHDSIGLRPVFAPVNTTGW